MSINYSGLLLDPRVVRSDLIDGHVDCRSQPPAFHDDEDAGFRDMPYQMTIWSIDTATEECPKSGGFSAATLEPRLGK